MADTFDIKRARALLEEDSPELNDVFQPWYGINIESRLDITSDGTMQLALEIIAKDSAKHRPAIKEAWKMINESFGVRDTDDPREMVPIDRFVDMGGIPPLCKEFTRRVYEGDIFFLLTLTWMATNDRATPHIVAAGAHKAAVDVIRKKLFPDKFLPDLCLNLLRNAAACMPTRATLRADGALEAALPYLEFLQRVESEEELDIKRGFRVASIVARLAGNDEQGEVAQLLRGNPALIGRTVSVLDKVLDAGPKGAYLGMRINPHFITMDLLVIAVSDANKPLLKSAVPVLVKALKLRGEANEEMVVDIINILLQLTYDRECLRALESNKLEIADFLEKQVTAPKYGINARLAAQNLLNALQPASAPWAASPAPAPQGRSSTMLGGLVRKAVKENKEGAAAMRRKSGVPNEKHVMLSYNWGVKPVVLRVDELLRANGVKTWIDERDMGSNLNDSMSTAIENASVLVVFMTAAYKESANCRKECEYADSFKVPIVYVMAEENYKPNGWLGIQLGRTVWVPCWNMLLAEQSLPQLLKATKSEAAVASKQLNIPPISGSSTPTSSASVNPSDSSDAVKVLQKELEATRAMVSAQMSALKEDFKVQLGVLSMKLEAALKTVDELKAAAGPGQ